MGAGQKFIDLAVEMAVNDLRDGVNEVGQWLKCGHHLHFLALRDTIIGSIEVEVAMVKFVLLLLIMIAGMTPLWPGDVGTAFAGPCSQQQGNCY